jgi:hypothetical protein
LILINTISPPSSRDNFRKYMDILFPKDRKLLNILYEQLQVSK